MTSDDTMIYLGASFENGTPAQQYLNLRSANRHGLVAGATGTGKTVTLQILAEGLSSEGVPVFAADIKGDLSGLGAKGVSKDFLEKRAKDIGFDSFAYDAMPVTYFDLYGEQGHPIRTTITEMGPLLLSRILNLNDTQEGVLNIVFKYADDSKLLLLDLKDLQKVLETIGGDAALLSSLKASYGNVSSASIGAVQRQLLVLDQQGGSKFFGEPAFDVRDLLQVTNSGKGMVNILSAEKLSNSPRLYSTFLLWLMSELFEVLPEAGDLAKPKLVFFFDEAHLLFNEASPALLEKIEQVVRLIRSKGVGVFFVTQNPADVPDKVGAQLGNRFQHALRAFTPLEQRGVKTAADTFRQNPAINTVEAITTLGIGEALVSTLQGDGTPSIVQRVKIRPPSSLVGPIDASARRQLIDTSALFGKYEDMVDRESAYEALQGKAAISAQQEGEAASGGGFWGRVFGTVTGPRGGAHDTMGSSMVKSVVRTMSSSVGRQIAGAVVGAVIGGAASRGRTGTFGGRIASSAMKNAGSAIARNVTGAVVRGVLGGLKR